MELTLTDEPQTIEGEPQKLESEPQNEPQKIEDKIIDLINKNNKITRTEMANIIGKSRTTIFRIIKKSKRIIFVGSARDGHWEIKSKKN